MGRQPLCSSICREEKVGDRLCWLWAQAALSTAVTKHQAGVLTALSALLTNTPLPGPTMGNSWGGSPGAKDSLALAFLESPQSFSLEEQEAVPVPLHFVMAENDKMLPEHCVTMAVPSVHGFIFLCPR